MRLSGLILAAVGAVFLGLGAGTARADLITNGGFETGDLTGWNVVGGFTFVETDLPPIYFVNSGVYAAQFGEVSGDDTLSQDVATIAGHQYMLDFYLSIDQDSIPNHFAAKFNGVTVLDLTNSSGQPYTHYSFTTTATGPVTTVEFDGANGPLYSSLDDVSVVDLSATAVPLPATAAIAPVLVVGYGLMRRFRRKTA